jgi:hypothetical protein
MSKSPGPIRVFYAHPSGETPEDTRKGVEVLRTFLESKLKKKYKSLASMPLVIITSGRQDHEAFFRGDWKEWGESVVVRKHSMTGKPRYQMFVVPQEHCGRATADIVRLALQKGRTVLRWSQRENKLFPVKKIIAFDPEDWTSGFQLA